MINGSHIKAENNHFSSLKITITGRVQGVGFRPFIYRLAKQFHLYGWVKNRSGEVIVLAQGTEQNLERFQLALLSQHPPLAIPEIESVESIKSDRLSEFHIQKSATSEHAQRHIPTDFFTCNDCLAELNNSQQRRYRYPFINCTQCGPRYTIIRDLPYDRPYTSMAGFPLCDDCNQEYSNPLDRRFHAQPLACAECGPELRLVTNDRVTNRISTRFSKKVSNRIPGKATSPTSITANEAALLAAVKALKQGQILAVKGVGGYHLICDATNEQAVQRLRSRKHRPDKPLAVMFSVSEQHELDQLKQYCTPDETESIILLSPQRPIVLIQTKKVPASTAQLAQSINPGLHEVGAMLAYSPLHYLILNDFGLPVVCTSGNLSGEPVLTDNQQAERRLNKIADVFLQHNRPILRPADDSVIRVIENKKRLFRIGRGIAPLELQHKQINLPYKIKKPVLAVGGQMKNTIALAWDNRVVISPHIGELDSKRSIEVFAQVIDDLCDLYRVKPEQIICDTHPDYYSSRYAKKYAQAHHIPIVKVQHHKAHASILSGEFGDNFGAKSAWLVFTWDGTGLGDDQSIWGGEGFYGQAGHWQRVSSIKPFYLQGGNKAAREPWRSACALLWENNLSYTSCYEPDSKSEQYQAERVTLAFQAWSKRLNTIPSTSMGRLFDAASALLGFGDNSSYEGQGPMLLEACLHQEQSHDQLFQHQLFQAHHHHDGSALPLYQNKELILADWTELLSMLTDKQQTIEQRALNFHKRIAETLIAQTKKIKAIKGDFRVGLSGGVFQNKYLTEYILKRLKAENFEAYLPAVVPYNDAGIAFGQIIEGLNYEQRL